MTPQALITVLLIWTPNDHLVLADAFYDVDECWRALSASGADGMCVSEAPPVAMLRPVARPDDLCRAPCTAIRPMGRGE